MLPTRLGPIVIKASNGYPVHNLNTGLNYTKFQEAIDAKETLNGHAIIVEAGTYYENIVVNKTVSIIGESWATTLIDGNGIAEAVIITANNTMLSGFTIQSSAPFIVAVRLENVSHTTITNNTITNSLVGLALAFSDFNTIAGNNITKNTYRDAFVNSSNNILRDNTMEGLYVSKSINNTLVGNTIGSFELSQSSKTTFYHNNVEFVHPGYEAFNNKWDDGYPSGGNYWSDYTGVDTNGDGIGDTPYIIDANNTDRYPLMHPWSSFPVHNIDTGSGYATIQEAIDANETMDGHVIFVETGKYYENVVVNKMLSLVGEDSSTTVIDGGGIGDVVYVTAWNVAIKNFQIRKSGSYYAPPNIGIRIEANYCNITDNNIIDNSVGVYLYESSHNNICSNNVTNKYEGITLHDSSNNVIFRNDITAHEYIGVALSWLSSGNTISENNIETNGRGISCADSSHNFISGNNVGTTSPNEGILLLACSDFIISRNNVANNSGDGIYLSHSFSISISQNNIKSNGDSGIELFQSCSNNISGGNITENGNGISIGSSSDNNTIAGNCITGNNFNGISFEHSSNNNVTGNSIEDNGYGIYIWGARKNTIAGNNITGSNYNGIWLFNDLVEPPNNMIYHNNFVGNTIQADSGAASPNPRVNVWDNGYPSGGNYWSDYGGTDSDYDGIGDSNYTISLDNVDKYPLMGMFSSFNTSYGYAVIFISNSSISNFSFNLSPIEVHPPEAILAFNVSGEADTEGFLRICIPKILINGSYVIMFDDEKITNTTWPQVRELPCSNETYVYFYINYTHSDHTMIITGTTIIPEFSSFLILPLFMTATLLAVIVYRRKRIASNRRQLHTDL